MSNFQTHSWYRKPSNGCKKGQVATKVLADSIANKFIFKNQQAPQSTDPEFDKKTEATLKVLADAVGSKYQFVK